MTPLEYFAELVRTALAEEGNDKSVAFVNRIVGGAS